MSLKDLVLDYIELPKDVKLPRPFVSMLLRMVYHSSCEDCVIICNPGVKHVSCVAKIDDILAGSSRYGYSIDDYKKANYWHVPGIHYVPGVKVVEKWSAAVAELACKPFSKNNHISRVSDYAGSWDGWLPQGPDGNWKRIEDWRKGMTFPFPGNLEDLVFGSSSSVEPVSTLTLKQMNTDGREFCARCNEPIKRLQGFSQTYNHCPRCEK